MVDDQKLVRDAIDWIRKLFAGESSGHDASHTMRVYRTATALARQENADLTVVQLAALLHDADDRKLSPETCEGKDRAVAFLREHGCEEPLIRRVVSIIGEVSFRGKDSVKPSTIEGACVQDADRLDAIGAVGIARAFAYGGHHGRAMYDPDIPPNTDMDAKTYYSSQSTTLNHFEEKLFLLRGMMNTEAAKRLAEQRDRFMRGFVSEFLAEWNGEA